MILPYDGRAPSVDPSAYVVASAVVVGDVTIGPESSVWFHAVVRGDIEPIRIGARTNVQDNATLHVVGGRFPTTLGDGVTVGHNAVVHGCTIGNRVLIGMGATILNGAEIGDDTIVAAGTLVTEGAMIPRRSLVMGSPGKVRRTLSDEDVASILEYAANYVRYKKDYE